MQFDSLIKIALFTDQLGSLILPCGNAPEHINLETPNGVFDLFFKMR